MKSIAVSLKRAARPSPRLLPFALVALLAVTALSSYNAVTTERFAWDLAISRWVQKFTVSESLEEVLFFMGVLGLAGAMMVAAWLWLWLKGHRTDGLLLLLTLLPNGLAFVLRDIYDRPRPADDLINVVGGPQGASYPSGHGLMVVFVYGFLFYLLTRHARSRRPVYIALGLLALYIPFAGLWLIHHGRHWPSDVFGGYMYGALCLVAWVGLHRVAKVWEARHPDFFTFVTLQRVAVKLGLARGA